MHGGGKDTDKKSKAEKKQAASGKTLEQKFVEEVRSDVSQETQEKDEDNMIHLLDEDSMSSWVELWSKESLDVRTSGTKRSGPRTCKHLEMWNEMGG